MKQKFLILLLFITGCSEAQIDKKKIFLMLAAGVRFYWETEMTMGFVPDAYNVLKYYAGL